MTMVRQIALYTSMLFLAVACSSSGTENIKPEEGSGGQLSGEKYEPEDGRCFVFIGQDLGAVGGVSGYKGYCDHFDTPAGVTVYLGVGGSDGNVYGLTEKANWGAGDCWADRYTQTARFDNSMIAVGLEMVGNETWIAAGERNKNLDKIAAWIRKNAPRPMFLRIGYEFDGTDWNHYVPETYIPAFRYIKDYFDAAGLKNVAYVWQSKGMGTSLSGLDKWYPGDDYVDWCGYSFFGQPDEAMIAFARKKNKPVFIAEATPVLQEGNNYFDADIKKPEVARKMWEEWFTGLFEVIEKNSDVVKAVSYINADWMSQPMWMNNATFNKCDARIQESEFISEKWLEEIGGAAYIHAADLDWAKLPH